MEPGIAKSVVDNGISVTLAVGLLWLVWYLFTKGLPKIIDTFAAAHEKTLDTFAAAQKEALLTFATSLKDEREAHERQVVEERAGCERRNSEVIGELKELVSVMNRNHSDILLNFKEDRHWVANLMNEVKLKVALDERGKQELIKAT